MTKEQQVALDAILREGGLDLGTDAQTLRSAFEETMKRVPVADDVEQRRTTVGGVSAVEVAIRGADSSNIVLYFHGGVYVIGSAAASVPLVSELARRADANAITVDYRLAPEHPFPAALEDARAAYEGLLAQGVDPRRIAFAGESAGCGLAVATLLGLRDDGRPLPCGAFLMSPYVDLTLSGETLLTKQALDPTLTPDGLRIRVPEYVNGADAADPRISPIFGDLRRLPPLLIQVGSHEILLSDALRLAGRAATADVQVTLEVTPGVPHVFQGFAAALDEGSAALDRAAIFLKTQLHVAQPTRTA
jgi:monoterpene epsilon-lactone hydrolase